MKQLNKIILLAAILTSFDSTAQTNSLNQATSLNFSKYKSIEIVGVPFFKKWEIITDAIARPSDSKSSMVQFDYTNIEASTLINLDALNKGFFIGFQGILGTAGSDPTNPVGFVRAFTDINVKLNDVDSINFKLSSFDPETVYTIILKDQFAIENNLSYEADFILTKGSRPRAEFFDSDSTIISLSSFKTYKRGVALKSVPFPKNEVSFLQIGFQISRSKQKDFIRLGADYNFTFGIVKGIYGLQTIEPTTD